MQNFPRCSTTPVCSRVHKDLRARYRFQALTVVSLFGHTDEDTPRTSRQSPKTERGCPSDRRIERRHLRHSSPEKRMLSRPQKEEKEEKKNLSRSKTFLTSSPQPVELNATDTTGKEMKSDEKTVYISYL